MMKSKILEGVCVNLKRCMTVSMTVSSLMLISACNSTNEDSESEYESPVNSTDTVNDSTDTIDDSSADESPYTEDELQSDPTAPSTSPDDYNSDGEYVPESGPTDSPADYNSDGEYKPVEEMTQEEIQEELEKMLGDSLGR